VWTFAPSREDFLRQQRRNRLALAQPYRPPDRRRHDLLRIDADRGEDGRVNVGDGHGIDRVVASSRIGCAERLTGPQAAAGEGDAEAVGPMVAAGGGVDLRRAAEFAGAE